MSTVRLRRLQSDYEKLRAFLGRQPRIRLIQAQGTPPERYQLEYQICGLREVDEQLQTVSNHIVEIALPLSYPRLPPQCRMLTPVFHPNIAPHAICIGDHWSAGEPLWSMVARIGEMITYQSYNTKSPLNGEAARWAESNLDKLPLDKTNFMPDDAQPAEEPAATAAPRAAVASPPARGDAGPAIPMAIPLPATPSKMDLRVRPPAQNDGPGGPSRTTLDIPAAPPQPSASAAPNIVIQCGQCGSRYSVSPVAMGKKVRCKKCQAVLSIPVRPSRP